MTATRYLSTGLPPRKRWSAHDFGDERLPLLHRTGEFFGRRFVEIHGSSDLCRVLGGLYNREHERPVFRDRYPSPVGLQILLRNPVKQLLAERPEVLPYVSAPMLPRLLEVDRVIRD